MKTKYSLKHILLGLAIIVVQLPNYTQGGYQQQMDDIFQISATKIPSGILINRSPDLIDLNKYNPAIQTPDLRISLANDSL